LAQCFNLGNTFFDVGHFKCSRGLHLAHKTQVPPPLTRTQNINLNPKNLALNLNPKAGVAKLQPASRPSISLIQPVVCLRGGEQGPPFWRTSLEVL